ncbi:MAG: family 20 glycosylhydrolase [Rikenellaceae bacterium]
MKFLQKILATFFVAMMLSCTNEVKVGPSMIIPEPQKMEVKEGQFAINNSLTIGVADETLMPIAEFLQTLIAKSTGITAKIGETGTIMLSVDSSKGNDEAYTLDITTDGVKIVGGGYGGVLYGIESFRQLLPTELEIENGAKNYTLAINCVSVEDAPHFEWRGLMLDVSRHFYDANEVKKLLDMMAYYKLNKFHWHLTDDQGWRIEIKKYPLLTENGAWRKFNSQDSTCMQRAIEQEMPDYEIDPAKLKVVDGDTLYGGFYTQDEIRDVVAHAAKLNIDVIPEIDMPGHFLAAVENYDGVSCSDDISWGAVFSSPICPGKDHALEFCKSVYDELFELFPYEYFHLGADEVDKANWKKCPDCQARMKANKLKDEHELQAWFVKYMERHFNANGKKLIGWDEIVEGGLSETATIMWWRNWVPKTVIGAAEQGNDIILTPTSNMYFDYQQGKATVKNLYMFMPKPVVLTDEQAENIKGIQANVWCESIPSLKRAEFMIFPRMLALSESAWTNPNDKDYDNFLAKMVNNLKDLDAIGINYRPLDLTGFSPVNSFTGPGELVINCDQKDLDIYYTTDGTTPTKNSTKLDGSIKFDKSMDVKLRQFRPDGSAGEIVSTEIIVEDCLPALENVVTKGEGLTVREYRYDGTDCAEIESSKLMKEYQIDSIYLPKNMRPKSGYIIEGYFEMAEDDIFAAKLLTADGGRLYIDDVLVVDKNSLGVKEIYVQKWLGKGVHKLRIEYFYHSVRNPRFNFRIFDKNDDTKTVSASKYNFKY